VSEKQDENILKLFISQVKLMKKHRKENQMLENMEMY
jgi:hypothetical protein